MSVATAARDTAAAAYNELGHTVTPDHRFEATRRMITALHIFAQKTGRTPEDALTHVVAHATGNDVIADEYRWDDRMRAEDARFEQESEDFDDRMAEDDARMSRELDS